MYYDTVCQFSCNDGYIGSGSQARRCQHNGTWSGQDFSCQSMYCNEDFNKVCKRARSPMEPELILVSVVRSY